ncbi:MAG TPA: thiamine-phosphate kinase, partial [Planctomycetota bacterium]|nr:thiamine-phosphate kinase [Planctomycetota bacterium]
GDDAALVRNIILKVDSVVEGTHFARATPARIGHKAMARPLSDLAAVAGIPRWALVSIVLPRGRGLACAKAVYRGAERTARRFGVRIVGGDLTVTRGPMVVTVTIAGEPGPRGFVRRSGARPGDRLFVTGPLGGAILGKHLAFTPRVREALKLRPTAMIDISDGFALDLRRLCEASGVGARVDLSKLPVSAAAKRLARRTGRSALDHALHDGEDYELLYTARKAGGIGVITRDRRVNVGAGGWNPSL